MSSKAARAEVAPSPATVFIALQGAPDSLDDLEAGRIQGKVVGIFATEAAARAQLGLMVEQGVDCSVCELTLHRQASADLVKLWAPRAEPSAGDSAGALARALRAP